MTNHDTFSPCDLLHAAGIIPRKVAPVRDVVGDWAVRLTFSYCCTDPLPALCLASCDLFGEIITTRKLLSSAAFMMLYI